MYLTTHVIVGAAVGSFMPGVPSAIAAGAVSHAVLDMIPHHDYSTVRAGVVDLAVGLAVLGAGWWAGLPATAIAGGLAGGLPDLEVALRHLGIWRWPLMFPSHSGLLPHRRAGLLPGLATQAVSALVALGALALRVAAH